MDASQFANFWAVQGHRVISTQSCQWYNTEPFVYLSIPFHRMVTPDRVEMARVLGGGPALVMRYACPAEESKCNGGLYVCRDKNYDIPSLNEKARNRTRRALRCCDVERVEFRDLMEWGHEINVQTYIRQNRDPKTLAYEKWARYCEAAADTPGFEAWGAYMDGKPAAYVVCALVEDCYHLLRQSSATDYLSYCPNNALTFAVTQEAIARPEVGYVSTGLKSVEDTYGLNRYKERMGYVLEPFRDQLVVQPFIKLLAGVGGSRAIRSLHQRNPGADFWRKAARVMDLIYQDTPAQPNAGQAGDDDAES
ncbi:MAG: GNAT family N-acetyltransferase [Armatimonadota bacterium]|nr:GNAT family N-acetyltransferase [bacterium]